jgi:DNA-binding NtrC family response regulator
MVGKAETLLIAEPVSKLADELDPWLMERQCAVRVVDNIKDVFMTLQNEQICVLVMDASLTRAMGYEAISIIKGLCRNLPIIVTTEENNPEQESCIRQKGIFYYHVKSFGMDELILAISNAMARSFQASPQRP